MKKTPTFDEFWQSYPLHRGRKEAERAWNRLTAAEKHLAVAALPAYTSDCQKHGIAYKYAQGWLNGQRWEDNLTEEVAVTKKENATQCIKPEDSQSSARDGWGNRIGIGITDNERNAFDLLKKDLLSAWSRHRDADNETALRNLLDGLELHGIHDERKVIYLHGSGTAFNRKFAVPWFWNPTDIDALVSRHFNGYKWDEWL